jgi:hypothetical protein
MKSPTFYWLCYVLLISTSPVSSANPPTKSKSLSFANQNDIHCTVNSKLYSHGFTVDDKTVSRVPVPDGTKIRLNWGKPGGEKVLFNGSSMLRQCDPKTSKITNSAQAKNMFSESGLSEIDRFIGAEFALCTSVDEGWYFFIKDNLGYISSTGPGPLPLAIVGMACNQQPVMKQPKQK